MKEAQMQNTGQRDTLNYHQGLVALGTVSD